MIHPLIVQGNNYNYYNYYNHYNQLPNQLINLTQPYDTQNGTDHALVWSQRSG